MSADMEEDELALSEGEDGLVEEGHPEDDGALEHEEQIVPCPLTQELVNQSLSLLCRTANGLAHAFVKMDLKDRQLTDISLISSFVHLRFLDISSNHMSDLSPLSALTHLLWLNVDRNMVTQLKGQPLGQLTFLQWLSLALNKLTDLDGLGCPALESLNLTGNSIQRVSGLQFNRLTNLVTLELRGNCLETTDGIYLPNLQRLYLAQNSIKHLEGLDKLERLTTLHLRDNQLETLDGMSPNMKSLQYLNVRGNLVSKQRALRSLWAVSKTLRALVLSENPLSEKEDYRMYLVSHLPVLERLDKEPISPEEKAEAMESMEDSELENEGAAEQEDS